MKKIIALLLTAILLLNLTACSGETAAYSISEATAPTTIVSVAQSTNSSTANTSTTNTTQNVTATAVPVAVEYESDDLEIRSDVATTTVTTGITLAGNSISVDGSGATVNGSIVSITSAGTYAISGVLNDGQIIIDTADAETVRLALNSVQITCSTGAPIYVANAEKVVITLAAGTQNYVTDGESYVFADPASDEPNAAIFSHDDLTINGDGALTVNANYNNGIQSKDDLKITGGTITVNAVNDGLKGKDSIAIKAGVITINAGADGLQSTNAEEAEKGYIAIEGGTLNITAGLDGIQAQTSLLVSGGDIAITTGGGSGNSSINGGTPNGDGMWGGGMMEGNANKPTESAKGLKAVTDLTITSGTISINSADDALHSNGSLTIDDGVITLASSDDGMHADATLVVNNGSVNITQSYEGLESSVIIINNGTVHIISSDDGVNVSDGTGNGMMGGRGMETISAGSYLEINGGYLYVDAGGDGLDSNGTGALNAGVVIVNGPTNNGNGSLDVGGNLVVNGGFLVAVGSAGMAQSPSTASTQYSALINLQQTLRAGSIVHIESEDGENILTFAPTKTYQTVVISSPEMEKGVTYVVYAGGQATGTVTDGLYTDGTYTAGTQVSSFTIASIVTGQSTGMGGPGGGRRRP